MEPADKAGFPDCVLRNSRFDVFLENKTLGQTAWAGIRFRGTECAVGRPGLRPSRAGS